MRYELKDDRIILEADGNYVYSRKLIAKLIEYCQRYTYIYLEVCFLKSKFDANEEDEATKIFHATLNIHTCV